MRTRVACLLVLVAMVPLLMGCGFLTMIGIQTKDDTKPAPVQEAAPPPAGGTTTPATPSEPEPKEESLYGKWTGTVVFTKYTMLLPEGEERATWEAGVAGTLNEVYSVVIDIYSDTEATLTLGEKTRITGSYTRDGDSVKFVFRKAGSDDFEVGASPPVTFTFTGAIEKTPTRTMAGPILYEVFTQDGGRGWTEDGEWIVNPE